VRVLFTSSPGWGHVHPMVPLAQACVRRGDDVLWSASPEACSSLEREGLRAAPAGLTQAESGRLFAERFPEFEALEPAERPAFMFPRLFGAVRAGPMLNDLMPIATDFAPDVVVHEAGELAGPIVAAALGVPNITHGFGGLVPKERVAAASAEVAPLWESMGLESRPYAGCYDHLYLDIYPPSLQFGTLHTSRSCSRCGRWHSRRPDPKYCRRSWPKTTESRWCISRSGRSSTPISPC
jgi:hypothetical protein